MYVCMYVCVCVRVCMYVCMYACMYVCTQKINDMLVSIYKYFAWSIAWIVHDTSVAVNVMKLSQVWIIKVNFVELIL